MSDNYVSSNDKPVEVPFSDDETVRDDELITDDPSLQLTNPVEYKARQAKKNERVAARERERKEMEKRLAEFEERDRKREAELRELRGFVAGASQSRQAPPGKDPYEERLDAVYARQKEAFETAQAEIKAGTYDKTRAAHYERVAREVESEKQRINAEMVLSQREPIQTQQQARNQWMNKYPEVYRDQRAYEYAEGLFKQKKAMLEPGQSPTVEMVDEAMQATMATFKLGPRKAATASERERMSGIPSSGSGGGTSAPSGIAMTKDLRKMATALYSDMPEEEAIKKWVNGPGRELKKQKVL
jgi:hypothetical protein